VLRIEGPHGNFFLRENSTRPLLLVAGGTGFAPVKSILEHEADLYLDALPRQWAREHPDFQYVPVLSEAPKHWQGLQGYVHEAVIADLAARGEDLSAFDVYVCGPPAMVRAAFTSFREGGLDEARFYSDAFEFQTPKAGG